MRATVIEKSTKDRKWIIPIILLIFSLLFEAFLGEIIYNASHDSIISAQKFLSEKLNLNLFNNQYDIIENDTTKNKTLFYLMDETEKPEESESTTQLILSNMDAIISEFFNFINANYFYLCLCALIFNFVNTYKVYVLANTIFLANFISSTLCFIFHSPRPYMVYYKIKAGVMFNDWGSPNTQIVVLVAFTLTLYEVLTQNKVMSQKLWAKIVLGVFLGIYCLIDIFMIFAFGNASYNQIIFSILIAAVCYMFIFWVLKVKLNDTKQFYNFIKYKLLYYIVINILLLVFEFLLYIFITDSGDEKYYGEHIDFQTKRLPVIDFVKSNFNYHKLFYLNEGNFCNVICFMMNLVSFIAIKLDLNLTYKDNVKKWTESNFEKPKIEAVGTMDSVDSGKIGSFSVEEYSGVKKSQWNHNGFIFGFLRFIILIILLLVCFLPSMFIFSLTDGDNNFWGFLFLLAIPMTLVVLGVFYLFKLLFIYIKLGKGKVAKS